MRHEKNPKEYDYYQEDGVITTIGDDEIENPDEQGQGKSFYVDFVGTALVVKEKYNPEYQLVPSHGPNHTFRIPGRDDLS